MLCFFFGDVELQPGAASEAGEYFYCGKDLDRTTLSRGDEKVTKCAARLVLVCEKGNIRIGSIYARMNNGE